MDSQQYVGFQPEEQSRWDKIKGNMAELVEFVAIILVLYVIIHYFIAEPHQVSGSSMVPNFTDKDLIITNKLPTHFGGFKRGEVIIFQNPRDASQDYIKRIIGLPGERLKILDSQIYINGSPLAEPYLSSDVVTLTRGFMDEGEEIKVPEGTFFVMGDNREGSSDSREWGPLKEELIIGQAWLRYWPVKKFEILKIGSGYKK